MPNRKIISVVMLSMLLLASGEKDQYVSGEIDQF